MPPQPRPIDIPWYPDEGGMTPPTEEDSMANIQELEPKMVTNSSSSPQFWKFSSREECGIGRFLFRLFSQTVQHNGGLADEIWRIEFVRVTNRIDRIIGWWTVSTLLRPSSSRGRAIVRVGWFALLLPNSFNFRIWTMLSGPSTSANQVQISIGLE